MTSKVVRLIGDNLAIERVVAEASKLIPPAGHEDWVERVVGLARMRVEVLRRMAQAGASPRSGGPAEGSPRTPGWWIVFVLGAVSAFVGSAVMLPPKGRDTQDPVLMMAVGEPAIVIGAVLMLPLAVLPLPRAVRGSPSAVALAVMAVIFAVFAGVLNILRHEALTEVVGAASVAVWAGGAIAVTFASVVLVLRLRTGAPKRSGIGPRPDTGVSEARRLARRLARELSYDASRPGEIERAWSRALDDLATEVDASVRDQARQLGPYAYTVWAYHDGEHELPRVETLRSR